MTFFKTCAGVACVCVAACSSDSSSDAGSDAANNDTGTTKDSGQQDTSTGMDAGGDASAMDSGTTDTGSDAAKHACWMGTKAQCGQCCLQQHMQGAIAWANNSGNCMCAAPVCGGNNDCGGSACTGGPLNANCQMCLINKYTSMGPCGNNYTTCMNDANCKAWVSCVVGCP